MTFLIESKHFNEIHDIIKSEIKAEDYEKSDLMFANSNTSWFDLIIALTAATFAKRIKKGKPNKNKIIKGLNKDGLQKALKEIHQYSNENMEIKNSLCGKNNRIFQHYWRIHQERGANFYYNYATEEFSEKIPKITEDQKNDFMNDVKEVIKSFAKEKDYKIIQEIGHNWLECKTRKESRYIYSGEVLYLYGKIKGHIFRQKAEYFYFLSFLKKGGIEEIAKNYINAVRNIHIIEYIKEIIEKEINLEENYLTILYNARKSTAYQKKDHDIIIDIYIETDVINNNLKTEKNANISMMTLYINETSYEKDIESELKNNYYGNNTKLEEFLRKIKNTKKKNTLREKIINEKKTNKTLSVDRIAQEMLRRVAKKDPETANKIMNQGAGSCLLPYEYIDDLIPVRTYVSKRGKNKGKTLSKKAENITFSTKNGKMFVSFKFTNEMQWKKNQIVTQKKFPETVLNSIKGKPASAVINHPIAKMLGNVKSARNNDYESKITFETIHDEKPMDIEK